METMSIVWLVLLIVLAVAEMISLGLTTIWFAGGALVALIISLVGGPIWLQASMFVLVSVVLLIFTRPIAVKYINKNTVKTNVDSIIGKTAKVTETIDNINATGTALVGGQEWTARSADDAVVIPVGSIVMIDRIEGVKIIVKKKEEVA